MSLSSKTITPVGHDSQGGATPRLLYALSTTTVAAPKDLDIHAWSSLAENERAPDRSLAMVELVADGFVAVVIATDPDPSRPLFRLRGTLDQLKLLYTGMLGTSGASSRGTLIVSAPRSSAEAVAVPAGYAAPPRPAPPGPPGLALDALPDPASCILCHAFAQLPSPPVKTGGGRPPDQFLLRVARLHVAVSRASHVEINGAGLDTTSALSVDLR